MFSVESQRSRRPDRVRLGIVPNSGLKRNGSVGFRHFAKAELISSGKAKYGRPRGRVKNGRLTSKCWIRPDVAAGAVQFVFGE